MFNRRQLLTTTTLLPLAACVSPTPGPGPIPVNILEDIQAVLTGLTDALPGLSSFLPTDLLPQIQGWVIQAQQIVASITSANNAGGSVSQLVQSFVAIVQQILNAIQGAGVALPAWLGPAIAAIQFLLPIILAFVIPASTTIAGGLRRSATPEAEAHARATLHNVRPRR